MVMLLKNRGKTPQSPSRLLRICAISPSWELTCRCPYYPEKMTALAYRYEIIYIVYSITH